MRKHTPSWSISGRHRVLRTELTPGPGAYVCEPGWNSHRVPLAKARRTGPYQPKENMPGPGSYSITMPFVGGTKIGTGKRSSTMRNEAPGPGSYEVRSRTNGPQFSLRPRFRLRSSEVQPGPGAYSPGFKLKLEKEPACVIGKQRRMATTSADFPGPGTYGSHKARHGPQWRFYTAKRKTRAREESPGPGAYNMDKY